MEQYFPLPISGKYPLCATVRTGRAIFLASLTPPLPDYPLLLPLWTKNGHALATVPLVHGESLLGAIGWSFGEPQRFDDERRMMLLAMAK